MGSRIDKKLVSTTDPASSSRTRIRFFIDPALSDEEIAKHIIEIAERHFNLPDKTYSQLETGDST